MARAKEPPEETEEPPAAESQDIAKRVDSLEQGQQTILGKLDQLLGGGAKKPADAATTPDPPGNIADEIRQQLEERDRKAAADAEKNAAGQTLAELQAKVAELTEKQPEPVPRRIERLMGWTP